MKGISIIMVTVDMPADLFERVKEISALEGTGYQAIIDCYVLPGQMNSRLEVKRLQFADFLNGIFEKMVSRSMPLMKSFTNC